METADTITKIIEWLALPLTYCILLIIFFVFIVRPFFSFLFNHERLSAKKAVQDARRKMEEMAAEQSEQERDEEIQDSEPETLSPARKDQQMISKLAESDPEKAGDLVKHWLKTGEGKKQG